MIHELDDDKFSVVRAGELRRQGFTASNRPPVEFPTDDVPSDLRYLIPLAKEWGVSDDLIRQDMVAGASREEQVALKSAIEAAEDQLDDWLAGPEAETPTPSDAYLAFTAMRMAADGVD